jgi:Family of unknown function (DUF6134)
MLTLRLAALSLLALVASNTVTHAAEEAQKQWRFKVMLDDKPIGHHYFTLAENDGRRDLTSEARFNVKLLFVTVYRYVHNSREIFQGDCLESIDARTNDNGKDLPVKGTLEGKGFVVTSHKTEHPSCIMTFAYWNPSMLSQAQLLNSQTGKYEPVTIKKLATETISVRGKPTPAEHYFVTGDKLKIDLWYSASSDWLALRSTTEDGRALSYQLE